MASGEPPFSRPWKQNIHTCNWRRPDLRLSRRAGQQGCPVSSLDQGSLAENWAGKKHPGSGECRRCCRSHALLSHSVSGTPFPQGCSVPSWVEQTVRE